MKELSGLSIRHRRGQLEILNQCGLPHVEEWMVVGPPEEMARCIEKLKVRGAPLIGVAAALCLAKYVEGGASKEDFIYWAHSLKKSRPTAVNLIWAVDVLLKEAEKNYGARSIALKAQEIFEEDAELCEKIARHGMDLIDDGDGVLTHCNTGGLATAGRGTALGVIRSAHERGKDIHVFVDETRPLLQGARLTSWELEKLAIPYTLICDNMAAALMASKRIHKVIVGADRVALNGDTANKIGTYSLAVSAHYHGIPFYVAAPRTTVDEKSKSGADIPIEQRKGEEVRGIAASFGSVCWAPEGGKVENPAFDITPHELISAWVFDEGCFHSASELKTWIKG
ncbi:MAG: S-methyl-5-thioribose-1-phosphate isomerase [Bacteriovoracales bacterium]|nr:S-methyl-5-thioribose-1-phosphate isomerase [Bacteriovoracales bacterium]